MASILFGFTLHYKNNTIDKDCKYKIHYFDGFIPGTNYYIYIYDNNIIKVVSQAECSLEECYNGTKTMPKYTKIIKFNEENTKFVINYLKKEFNLKSNKEKYISYNELSSRI